MKVIHIIVRQVCFKRRKKTATKKRENKKTKKKKKEKKKKKHKYADDNDEQHHVFSLLRTIFLLPRLSLCLHRILVIVIFILSFFFFCLALFRSVCFVAQERTHSRFSIRLLLK